MDEDYDQCGEDLDVTSRSRDLSEQNSTSEARWSGKVSFDQDIPSPMEGSGYKEDEVPVIETAGISVSQQFDQFYNFCFVQFTVARSPMFV